MPKVIIVSPPYPLSRLCDVETFGELHYIFPTHRPSVFNVPGFAKECQLWYEQNYTEEDYFAFTGPQVQVSIAFGALCKMLDGYPHALFWDRSLKKFIKREYHEHSRKEVESETRQS